MKKKDKELTKYTTIYDKLCLSVSVILFVVVLGGYLWIKISKQEFPDNSIAGRAYLGLLTGPYIVFPFLVFYLRTRVIDQNGISAKYFGARYKYISWENLMNYRIELYVPRLIQKKYIREALIFTSKPNHKGKSTVIIVYATKEARALAEKYFGPPAFVQEGVTFDGKDER